MQFIGNIGDFARYMQRVLGLDTDTGFLRTEYDDIFPDDAWLVPQGASAPDEVTATIGGVPMRLRAFDGAGTEELMTNKFEVLHWVDVEKVNAGTLKLEWHVHASPSTTASGVVRWYIDYMYWPVCNGEIVAPVPCTTVYIDVDVQADSQYCHYVHGVEIPVPAGGVQIGGKFGVNVRRTPTGADTYPNDMYMLQAAMHAPGDSRGSRQRYIK